MAVSKLSQIPAAGSNLGSSDFLIAVQSGTTDVLFTAANVFAFANLLVSSNTLSMINPASGTTAQSFHVYNTFTNGSNYERGVFDWSTTSNMLTIGTQSVGTGSRRPVFLCSDNGPALGFGSAITLAVSGNITAIHSSVSTVGDPSHAMRNYNSIYEIITYSGGSVAIGPNSAISTSATDGFLYIPTCAGTPSGTPRSITGKVAMVYDTTNNKFYIYNGAWKGGTNPGVFT